MTLKTDSIKADSNYKRLKCGVVNIKVIGYTRVNWALGVSQLPAVVMAAWLATDSYRHIFRRQNLKYLFRRRQKLL